MPSTRKACSIIFTALLVSVAAGCGLFGLGGDSETTRYEVNLSGEREVPEPIDTEAAGDITLVVNRADEEIDFILTVSDIEQATQGHIHLGGPDENGPAVAFLLKLTDNVDGTGAGTPRSFDEEQVIARGTITEEDIIARPEHDFGGSFEELVEAMSQGQAYVNVHTTAHPSGVIRGQIGEEARVDSRPSKAERQ